MGKKTSLLYPGSEISVLEIKCVAYIYYLSRTITLYTYVVIRHVQFMINHQAFFSGIAKSRVIEVLMGPVTKLERFSKTN